MSDRIENQLAHALRDRRALAVPHGLEERLHAAVRGKRRGSALVPIALAAAVVALAVVVIAIGGRSSSDDDRRQVVRTERAPAPDRGPAGLPPLKPVDDQAVLQTLFDGFDPGLDAAQMRRARGVVATFERQRAIHAAKRDGALADLRSGAESANARARLAVAESEIMRAEIDMRVAAIDLLGEKQRQLLHQGRPGLAPPGKTVPSAQTGELVLTTDPAGARAIIDGIVVGITPLHVTLAVGNHRLRLEQAGYQVREQDIEISATERLALLVAMYKARTP